MTRLVVAEDDPDIRHLVTKVLARAGYETEAVDGGRAALEACRRHTPQLLVLDVNMPDLSGIEVCSLVKAGRATSAMCVLLMSAQANARSVAAGLAAGADDFLSKPFSPRELVRRVQQLIDRTILFDPEELR